MWKSQKSLARAYDLSRVTVWRKVQEMKQDPEYASAVITDGRLIRIQEARFKKFLRRGNENTNGMGKGHRLEAEH